jgi:hypothetical protein
MAPVAGGLLVFLRSKKRLGGSVFGGGVPMVPTAPMIPRRAPRASRPATLALLAAFAMASGAALAGEVQTVTGEIRPHTISRGVVKECYLKTDEGRKLLVLNNEKGKELLALSKSRIRATGYIRKPKSGKEFENIIDVVEFEVLESADAAPPAEPATQTAPDSD